MQLCKPVMFTRCPPGGARGTLTKTPNASVTGKEITVYTLLGKGAAKPGEQLRVR